jgi:hypothetical protein
MSRIEALKCPSCGAAIYDEDAKRCEYCGSALHVEGRKPEEKAEPAAPGYDWICAQCGGVTPRNFRFCIKCGAAAGDSPRKAPITVDKPAPAPAPEPAPEPVRVRRPRRNPFRGVRGIFSGMAPFFIALLILIGVLYFNNALPAGTMNFIDKTIGRGFAIFGELTGGEGGEETGARVRVLAGWPLKLYQEPGTAGAVLGELQPGEEMTVLETRGDWYRVRTADGREGWVQYIIRGSKVVG